MTKIELIRYSAQDIIDVLTFDIPQEEIMKVVEQRASMIMRAATGELKI